MPKARSLDSYIIDENTGCWNWPFSLDTDGYGRWKSKRVYKIIYEKAKGRISKGLILHHLCFNRVCVNPDHMKPITQIANCRNKINSKIKPAWIELIKFMWFTLKYRQHHIAQVFGVHQCHISRIINQKRWKEVS